MDVAVQGDAGFLARVSEETFSQYINRIEKAEITTRLQEACLRRFRLPQSAQFEIGLSVGSPESEYKIHVQLGGGCSDLKVADVERYFTETLKSAVPVEVHKVGSIKPA